MREHRSLSRRERAVTALAALCLFALYLRAGELFPPDVGTVLIVFPLTPFLRSLRQASWRESFGSAVAITVGLLVAERL